MPKGVGVEVGTLLVLPPVRLKEQAVLPTAIVIRIPKKRNLRISHFCTDWAIVLCMGIREPP